jgi:hypothetical protein
VDVKIIRPIVGDVFQGGGRWVIPNIDKNPPNFNDIGRGNDNRDVLLKVPTEAFVRGFIVGDQG